MHKKYISVLVTGLVITAFNLTFSFTQSNTKLSSRFRHAEPSRVPEFKTNLPLLLFGSVALGLAVIVGRVRRIRGKNNLREAFPFYRSSASRKLIYMDSAATTQKPQIVLDAMNEFYRKCTANVHRSSHAMANEATTMFEDSRKKIARFLRTSETNLVITRGATSSLNDLSRALAKVVKSGEKIVISEAAHSSNFLPWVDMAKATKAELVVLPATASETEILAELDNKVRVVALPHVSHVFGSEIPIGKISGYLKANGSEAFLIVDGCQALGHLVRAEMPQVDAYVISGHKMCGPTGVGATYISDRLKSVIGNFNLGGGVVDWFDKHGNFQLSPFPHNLEAGTPPIAEAVGLGVAAEFLDERRSAILVKEAELREYLISQVKRHLPGAEILSDSFPRVIPLVSLKFPDGMSAADIAVLISGRICVRAGVHCAGPLHAAVGADGGSLRLSLGFYNSKSEVDYAVRAIVENARAVQ